MLFYSVHVWRYLICLYATVQIFFMQSLYLYEWLVPDATKIDPKVCASELDPLDLSSTLEGWKAPSLAQHTMPVSDRTVSQGSCVINGGLTTMCATSGCWLLKAVLLTFDVTETPCHGLRPCGWLSAHHSAYRYWVPCTLYFDSPFLFDGVCIERLDSTVQSTSY